MSKEQRNSVTRWIKQLRDKLCLSYEQIESDYANCNQLTPVRFTRKEWQRSGGGGGEMSIMYGNVFEKVGVNISTVHGEFSVEFRKKIPGAEDDPGFFAAGLSLVAHMRSPLVPTVHFNSRYIETTRYWFGGGGDLTPTYFDDSETGLFHEAFKAACDRHDKTYYPKFSACCDEYFYLPHRNEKRGAGGIFYDYLDNKNFASDFAFAREVGLAMFNIYPQIVRNKMFKPWTEEQRQYQLIRRGRYVEFNLLYDRGIKFGLETGGNIEAMFMSLPPVVKWL